MESSDDILQPIMRNQLLNILDVLKNNHPLSFDFVCLLKMYLHWEDSTDHLIGNGIDIPDKLRGKWFSHKKGEQQNATIICITGEQDYMIYPFTLEESCQELKECLVQTKRINWKLQPWIGPIHRPNQSFLMEQIISELQLELLQENKYGFLKMDKQLAKELVVRIPIGYKIRNLVSEDAEFINNSWPHKDPGSERFIQALIEINGGLGICGKDEKLVSWIIKNEFNGLGMLHVVPAEEGRQLGSCMVMALSKRIAVNDDIDVIAFTADHNTRARDLLRRLGFIFL